MAKINVLDKHVAELIAAGEVVERPASAAKELVENCIDAESSSVTVEMKNGGVTFLRAADNGCGIAREDVPLAFLRHATSKVSGREDLNGISTLGFRGEALASIAAVSKVEMLTRTEAELAGTRYGIEGGEVKYCEDAGCPVGTAVTVRDLFYNTPARMKFLKKDVTEGNAVAAVVEKEALAHPEIAFRLIRDGRETLRAPGDKKLKSAVYAVFGSEFTRGLIPVKYEMGGIRVSGYVSRPSAARPNRSMQNFFINGRFVKSRTAMVALEQAFKGSLMTGKFPACVLHLTVPFAAVDVNVHPAKIEVRFLNEKPIFDAVYHGVKSTLNAYDIPEARRLFPAKPPERQNPGKPVSQLRIPRGEEFETPGKKSAVHPVETDIPDSEPGPAPFYRPGTLVPPDIERDEEDTPPETEKEFLTPRTPPGQPPLSGEKSGPEERPADKFVGEAFGTYILFERGDALVFVDKHAAHERLLYEKLKARGGEAFSQMLLEPVTVTLSEEEYSAVLGSLDACGKAGFEIEDFGGGSVLVRSAPMSLSGGDVKGAVEEIAGYLAENRSDLTTRKLDWIYQNIACRAAVKAGDPATPQELMELVRRAEKEDIRYCPHGRPVSFLLTRKELERRFGRSR